MESIEEKVLPTSDEVTLEARLKSLSERYPVSLNLKGELEGELSKNAHLTATDEGLERALLNVLASRYTPTAPPSMGGGALPVVTKHSKPSTIKEAGLDAVNYLRKNAF